MTNLRFGSMMLKSNQTGPTDTLQVTKMNDSNLLDGLSLSFARLRKNCSIRVRLNSNRQISFPQQILEEPCTGFGQN